MSEMLQASPYSARSGSPPVVPQLNPLVTPVGQRTDELSSPAVLHADSVYHTAIAVRDDGKSSSPYPGLPMLDEASSGRSGFSRDPL